MFSRSPSRSFNSFGGSCRHLHQRGRGRIQSVARQHDFECLPRLPEACGLQSADRTPTQRFLRRSRRTRAQFPGQMRDPPTVSAVNTEQILIAYMTAMMSANRPNRLDCVETLPSTQSIFSTPMCRFDMCLDYSPWSLLIIFLYIYSYDTFPLYAQMLLPCNPRFDHNLHVSLERPCHRAARLDEADQIPHPLHVRVARGGREHDVRTVLNCARSANRLPR